MDSRLIKIFAFCLSYFSPISTIIHVMLIFIFIDAVSAIWAAKKNKIPVESRKLRKTIQKMVWYIAAVMMAHMMEITFHLEFSHLAQITGGFVCMVEIKSVFENITKITNEPIFIKIYKLFEKKTKNTFNLNEEDFNEPIN